MKSAENSIYQEPEFAIDISFNKKFLSKDSKRNPEKAIPLKFTTHHNQEPWTYQYDSVVIEAPKSIVCIYKGRPITRGDPSVYSFIVKFQLKYAGQPWSDKLYNQVKKRYYNTTRGDSLCARLSPSNRLCSFFGTYILTTQMNRVWSEEGQPAKEYTDDVDEAWVIQLFEHLPGDDLYTFMTDRKSEERLDRLTLLQIASDLAEGTAKLHQMGIYHGDMKPENVVLRNEHSKKRAVLIDFDFASTVQDERLKRGTPRYLAPEYVASYRNEGVPIGELGKYGREFDMWAIGAMLWSLFYGTNNKFYLTSYTTEQLKERTAKSRAILALLDREKYEQLMSRYLQKPTVKIPPKLQNLIRALLAYEPTERPTAEYTFEKLQGMIQREQERRTTQPSKEEA